MVPILWVHLTFMDELKLQNSNVLDVLNIRHVEGNWESNCSVFTVHEQLSGKLFTHEGCPLLVIAVMADRTGSLHPLTSLSFLFFLFLCLILILAP